MEIIRYNIINYIMPKIVISVLFVINFYIAFCRDIDIDRNGYIVYCPCMGKILIITTLIHNS